LGAAVSRPRRRLVVSLVCVLSLVLVGAALLNQDRLLVRYHEYRLVWSLDRLETHVRGECSRHQQEALMGFVKRPEGLEQLLGMVLEEARAGGFQDPARGRMERALLAIRENGYLDWDILYERDNQHVFGEYRDVNRLVLLRLRELLDAAVNGELTMDGYSIAVLRRPEGIERFTKGLDIYPDKLPRADGERRREPVIFMTRG
jgi:hypothetical protein